jgi:hypothetical protein
MLIKFISISIVVSDMTLTPQNGNLEKSIAAFRVDRSDAWINPEKVVSVEITDGFNEYVASEKGAFHFDYIYKLTDTNGKTHLFDGAADDNSTLMKVLGLD